MKTATVTWISYKNYGTFLQAYALQKTIESLGYDNTIISDFPVVQGNVKPKKIIKISEITNCFDSKNILLSLRRIHGKLETTRLSLIFNRSLRQFDKFKNAFLNVLEINSVDEYTNLNAHIDCFICGSDQIWSLLDYNYNEFFFLNFSAKSKIAYAPSIGQISISKEQETRLKYLLSDFKALSCRESFSAKQLSVLTDKRVQWVCDPTLLLTREDWHNMSLKSKVEQKQKYILCYFLENKHWYFEYAKELSSFLECEWIVIPNKLEYLYLNNTCMKPVGPVEFVSLINEAEYVLTDSYHGSIFSLIFNKQFLYLKRFEDGLFSQNIRIQSLFEYLHIMDFIISEKEFDVSDLKRLDYEAVNSKIERHRKESLEYLRRSLKDANN